MSDHLSGAFHPSHRLVPSRFPPVPLFDTAATTADVEKAMELCGWTNDRLVPSRLNRLPKEQWVFGRANSSIVMASFLHVAPGGMRFNNDQLGAWYAAHDVRTAITEVAHHLRRDLQGSSTVKRLKRTYRTYSARLDGDQYVDIHGKQALYKDAYDPEGYAGSQAFGEKIREAGRHGILYDSLRHKGGMNVVAFVPQNVLRVTQTDHFEITVQKDSRAIDVRRLKA